MKTFYIIVLYLNIPVVFASLFLAIFFLKRAKDKIYFNLGMVFLALTLWVLTVILSFFQALPISSILLTKFSFFFGIFVPYYFFIFSINFLPFKSESDFPVLSLLFLTVIIACLSFLPNYYVIDSVLEFPFLRTTLNHSGLFFYLLYFLSLVLYSFSVLLRKYKDATGIHRVQLKKLCFGTLIALAVNFLFSFLIYFFTDFDTTPIGVFFIFSFLFFIYSVVFFD